MLDCSIISPEVIKRYRLLSSVKLPAYRGEAQILPGHAEAFMVLKKGKITLEGKGIKGKIVNIEGGECHVLDNVIKIIL